MSLAWRLATVASAERQSIYEFRRQKRVSRQNCRAAPSLIPSTLYATNDRDEVYSYDGLQRLAAFDEGTLSGTSISGTPTKEEDWTLDALGNWGAFIQKASGTTTLNQSRTHNKVNEIDVDDNDGNAAGASITASTGANWFDPQYDKAGNMTSMPQPASPTSGYTLVYDAWNRLVAVKNGANFVQKNEFDGLHRRIVKEKYVSGSLNETRHYYYNQEWQVVEERIETGGAIDTDPVAQYVWHPHYVDSLAMRRHDGNANGDIVGAGEGKHYYLQDANYNVTAVTDNAGSVVERYAYTPYGAPTVLDDNFSVDSDATSDISNVYLYTGRERDPETGLQNSRYRFYASHLGRWLQRDPIGYTGTEFSLYGYVDNQPTITVDPSGLSGKVRIILKLGRNICKVMDLSHEQAKRLLKSRVQDAKRPRSQRKPTTVFVNVDDEKAARELAEQVSPCGEAVYHPVDNAGHPGHYHPVKGHGPEGGGPRTDGTPHIGCEYIGGAAVMVPYSDSLINDLLNQGAELIIDITPIVGDLRDLPELIAATGETIDITIRESKRTVRLRCCSGEQGIDRISKGEYGCEKPLRAGCWRDASPGY